MRGASPDSEPDTMPVSSYKGSQNRIDIVIRKSPLAPLCQRGVIPPFSKGRLGGILQINVFIIMRPLIT